MPLNAIFRRTPLSRPVPWNGFDVFLIIFGHLCLQMAMGAFLLSRPTVSTDCGSAGCVPASEFHPLIVLIQDIVSSGRYEWLLIPFLAAVVVAPLVEEFIYRVLFQGYCEKLERQSRQHLRAEGRARGMIIKSPFPSGLFTVFMPALVFAAVHYRPEGDSAMTVEFLLPMMLVLGVSNTITLICAIIYLKLRGARWSDLGMSFSPRTAGSGAKRSAAVRGPRAKRAGATLKKDLLAGLLSFLLVLPVLLVLHPIASFYLGPRLADPVLIFAFAVPLGLLYFRQRRYFQIVAMHAALNCYSFIACLFI